MKTTELGNDLRQTAADLGLLIGSLDQDQIDQIPFEGSWTAGQTAEHILKSASGLVNVVKGNTALAQRPPDEKVATLKGIFLNFDTKMKSPDFIVPTETVHPKAALLNDVNTTFDAIAAAADSLDPTALCLEFELPNMGKLTRLEWCTFVLTHTQRHVHQLSNIVDKLVVATA